MKLYMITVPNEIYSFKKGEKVKRINGRRIWCRDVEIYKTKREANEEMKEEKRIAKEYGWEVPKLKVTKFESKEK